MKRTLTGLALLVLAACSGGSGAASSSSSTSAATPPAVVRLNVDVQVVFTGAPLSFARQRNNDFTCGAAMPGSPTGFDERGTVTVKDRAGKLLADGKLPHGDTKQLQAQGTTFQSMTCHISAQVAVYEQPSDAAVVSFDWPDAGVHFSETTVAADFKDGLTFKEAAP